MLKLLSTTQSFFILKTNTTCTPHQQESIDLTELASDTVYKFMVRAESTAEASPESKVSDPFQTLLPISAPGKPRATFVTHKSIMLEWDKPKFGAKTVKQYHLLYRCIDDPQLVPSEKFWFRGES